MTIMYSGTAGLLQIIVQDAIMASAGSCAGAHDPDLWHRDDQSDPDYCAACTAIAVGICQSCPIQLWCEARAAGETTGVWAGSARSASTDLRRGTMHSCKEGKRMEQVARMRAYRARLAEQRLTNVSVQRGDIPLKG